MVERRPICLVDGRSVELPIGDTLPGGGSTITLTGDVTGSGTGSITTAIANDAVTYAKIQNVSGNTVLARSSPSSGDVGEVSLAPSQLLGRGSGTNIAAISIGSGLIMSGVTLSAPGSTVTLTGDVTGSGTGSITTAIANDAVTYAKIQNVSGYSVLARKSFFPGDVEEVALSVSQLLGRGSTGDIAPITLGTNLSMSGTTLNVSSAGGESTTQSVNQTAHGFSVGDVLYVTGSNTYALAQANNEVNAEVVGIVSSVADANNFTLLTSGTITTLSTLTAGEVYFLSPSSAGDYTITKPSTLGQISKPLFIATSSTSAIWLNFRGVEVGPGSILPSIYPVGCIYTEVTGVNPATTFGFGTWAAFGAGRCLVGVDTGQTEFDTVEETGGDKNLQSHTHTARQPYALNNGTSGGVNGNSILGGVNGVFGGSANFYSALPSFNTGTEGSGTAGNLQPYITVYFWKRTA